MLCMLLEFSISKYKDIVWKRNDSWTWVLCTYFNLGLLELLVLMNKDKKERREEMNGNESYALALYVQVTWIEMGLLFKLLFSVL